MSASGLSGWGGAQTLVLSSRSLIFPSTSQAVVQMVLDGSWRMNSVSTGHPVVGAECVGSQENPTPCCLPGKLPELAYAHLTSHPASSHASDHCV